jgi:hypothetical protein
VVGNDLAAPLRSLWMSAAATLAGMGQPSEQDTNQGMAPDLEELH